MWRESSPLCDRAVRVMKSKTYIFSDSVLCLGGISPELGSSLERQNQMVFGDTCYLKELDQIDAAQMECERKNFPRLTALGILSEISKDDGRI